ncbi:MAG TPA: KTSC domain-containing protein [Caulobacteraceae bacterium]|nr:KTSC domain-containing protein [Caulobacteraceae bacterium]
MPHVDSAVVDWIGYDPDRKTLFVRLLDGDLWSYEPVSTDVYAAFLLAASKGDFLRDELKPAARGRRLERASGHDSAEFRL